MHQLAWPNPNCTALNYKMPETSKVGESGLQNQKEGKQEIC